MMTVNRSNVGTSVHDAMVRRCGKDGVTALAAID
jgi:hypothetical protein